MLDDVRRALGSEHPPEWHRERLDDTVAVMWRWVLVIVVVLVLGALADAAGLIG